MRLITHWHRKVAFAQALAATRLSSSLAGIRGRLARGRHAGRLSADGHLEPALDAAIGGLRGVMVHAASADALTDLGNQVRALAATTRDDRPAGIIGAGSVVNLEGRIASIADAIAALRAQNRRRATQNIENTIAALNEKIDQLQSLRATPPGSRVGPAGTRTVPAFRDLQSIERAVAELTRNVVEMRAEIARCLTAQASPPLVPELPSTPAAASPAPARPFAQAERAGSSASAPLGKRWSPRPRRLPKNLAKVLTGVGLAAALAFLLQLLVFSFMPHGAFESARPQAKLAERGPRLDSRVARSVSADLDSPTLAAANLPQAFGLRLIALAAAGDPAAAYEVGIRLSERPSAPGAGEQAIIWLERAAKAGLAPAQLTLGGIYENGLGVPKDLQRARVYYLAAASRGNARAMHNLAVLHAQGVDGKADHTAAAVWFRKAALHGVTDSQFNLAVLYEHGTGVELSLAEAYKWFALAAHQGDSGAARKRAEIARLLDASSLDAIDAAVEAWVAAPQPADSVTVRPPPGGWDQAPAEPPQKAKRDPQISIG